MNNTTNIKAREFEILGFTLGNQKDEISYLALMNDEISFSENITFQNTLRKL